MKANNDSNRLIKWMVVFGDFLLMNVIIFAFFKWVFPAAKWEDGNLEIFLLINNSALLFSQIFFSTIVYYRIVSAGDVLKRVICLTLSQAVEALILLKIFDSPLPIVWLEFGIGSIFFASLLVKRLFERWFIRLYREAGRNTRTVVFVGSDSELLRIYERMGSDATLGFSVLGYYADSEIGTVTNPTESVDGQIEESHEKAGSLPIEEGDAIGRKLTPLKKLGSLQTFLNALDNVDNLTLGDELYVSLSRKDKRTLRKISQMCDHNMIRFFYVPVSVESIGLNLKREIFDDIEIFTTYENPLDSAFNRALKRTCDIIFSLLCLIPTAIIFPFVFVMIKIQSPGPILFKQKRTGLDGKEFEMLKFRSMHVNKDADTVQATKDDPRKFPFGNFMRKTNIDELPQFLNVLKGDMSVVGPRPHMLAHTEMYSHLIDKYMVRHFVRPGVTGWAQVTGYRGETKELWQMEGRVKRDIWYIENWTIWLDFRIIWITFKSFFVHDKNAY